jgi:hypothetical protein
MRITDGMLIRQKRQNSGRNDKEKYGNNNPHGNDHRETIHKKHHGINNTKTIHQNRHGKDNLANGNNQTVIPDDEQNPHDQKGINTHLKDIQKRIHIPLQHGEIISHEKGKTMQPRDNHNVGISKTHTASLMLRPNLDAITDTQGARRPLLIGEDQLSHGEPARPYPIGILGSRI